MEFSGTEGRASGLVIAIDGPAGAGKSTVAKMVATRLGCRYIDTGAMYRTIALKALRGGYSLDSGDELADLAKATGIDIVPSHSGGQRIFMDGIDVTEDIRLPEVSASVSRVAAVAGVRDELVRRQREMVASGGAVMDGRDIGTVVLPGADRKFYLDASPVVRAKRRCDELVAKGIDASLDSVLSDLTERDRIDTQREISPLTIADDAIWIDSTDLNVGEVADLIIDYCR